MSSHLSDLIDRFRNLNVLVIGEAILDSYLEGMADRLCPEAPVPAVTLTGRSDSPGGAANTAANVAGLGGRVAFLSVVGDDPEGETLRRTLAAHGVTADGLVIQPGRRTLAKQRVCAGSQILLRLDQGSTEPADDTTQQELIGRLHAAYHRCDAVIVSDYGYGVMAPAVIAALGRLQAVSPRLLLVDAKTPGAYRDASVTAVKPNYGQAQQLLGLEDGNGERVERIAMHGRRLLELMGVQVVAVTLDVDGALIFEQGCPPYRTYARPAHHARSSGAGDTFAGAFALALAAGGGTPAAAEIASAAAGIVVERDGTSRCSVLELRERLTAEAKYVDGAERIRVRAELYRRQGRRIVFTNGCFDILHRGHISYLEQAKRLGDVLIVALNSDDSVRRLKGPSRPINTLEDRAHVLAALSCVDDIVGFDTDTPVDLVRAVRPDIYVKGGDYTREMLPEAPVIEALGGSVRILPYVDDRSTSVIIDRIRGQQHPVNGSANVAVPAPARNGGRG